MNPTQAVLLTFLLTSAFFFYLGWAAASLYHLWHQPPVITNKFNKGGKK